MKPRPALAIALAVTLSLATTAALASPEDDLQRGREAYGAGNYAEAASWYRKAADAGDATAL